MSLDEILNRLIAAIDALDRAPLGATLCDVAEAKRLVNESLGGLLAYQAERGEE